MSHVTRTALSLSLPLSTMMLCSSWSRDDAGTVEHTVGRTETPSTHVVRENTRDATGHTVLLHFR